MIHLNQAKTYFIPLNIYFPGANLNLSLYILTAKFAHRYKETRPQTNTLFKVSLRYKSTILNPYFSVQYNIKTHEFHDHNRDTKLNNNTRKRPHKNDS